MSEKKKKIDDIIEDVTLVGIGIFMIPLLPFAGIEVAYKFLKKRHEKVLAIEMEKEKERQKERERREAIKAERRKYIR